jgi:hypothetical protein
VRSLGFWYLESTYEVDDQVRERQKYDGQQPPASR